MHNWYDNINDELKHLEQIRNYRFFRNFPRGMLNVSSNDYLGISGRIELQKEFFQQQQQDEYFLMSAVSSRLLSGNHKEYERLEKVMTGLFNGRACLTFNSGYHANIGILPAITQPGDLIISDKSVHASLIDGIRLCKCKSERYNHLDYTHLEKILVNNYEKTGNIFVVTESIFSMDGDEADMQKLADLKKKYKFSIYLDEAHSFGVRGRQGLGCAEEAGLVDDIDLIVGTFGKAIASSGAFVICGNRIRDFLINKSRSLIFTTAQPPVNIAWTRFIMERLPDMKEIRNHLHKLCDYYNTVCEANHIAVESRSHIKPYVTGSNESAVRFSDKIQKEGIYVLPIRYPTVPEGTARIRFSLNAGLSMDDVTKVIDLIRKIKEEN